MAPGRPPGPPDCRLPTVRDLASQLDLAPDTTVQAYQELERDGVAEGRGGRGTFVVDDPPTSTLWRSSARGSHSSEEAHRALDRALSSEAESERFPTSPTI